MTTWTPAQVAQNTYSGLADGGNGYVVTDYVVDDYISLPWGAQSPDSNTWSGSSSSSVSWSVVGSVPAVWA